MEDLKLMKNNPNIIYILADDLGYGDLSCLNPKSKIKTVALDNLCDSGMCFTDAHASSALCSPSRYSILTGRYNWRSRLKKGVLGGFTPHLIEDNRSTVATILRDNGYKTMCVGKWHLGMDWATKGEFAELPNFEDMSDIDYEKPIKFGPTAFGFDYYYGISASLDMPPYVYIENDKVTQAPTHLTEGTGKQFWRKGATADNFVHREVMPTLLQKAKDKISESKENPFYLYLPLPAPHAPILPTEEFIGKSGIGDYGDFVLMCDDFVGQIKKHICDEGIQENTIVIFAADNGCSPIVDFPALAELGHNPSYVFRGHKADIFEGGHRIPLIVSWPAKIAPKTTSAQIVCLCDLFATVAELLEIELPDNIGEDSFSNLPLWLGENKDVPVREALVHQSLDGSLSIRKGDFKLEMCLGSGGWSAPIPDSAEEAECKTFQLYNLKEDISEKNNVFEKHPAIVKELKALLVKYVNDGRSAKGTPQKNNGEAVWNTISWIEEEGFTPSGKKVPQNIVI